MSTVVRLAQSEDAEGISQVILAALHSSNARDYPADVIARVASNFTPDAVLDLLKRRVVLVAVQDRVIVATAALDANVVRSVFVNPTLQGQGIGRLLMIEIELRAREAGVTTLSVPSSLTAEPFYTKLGFHTVRDVYHGNERTLVMEKALLSRHPIGPYRDRQHRGQVVALWQEVFGYDTAHNLPTLAIDKKLAVNDGLFFCGDGQKDCYRDGACRLRRSSRLVVLGGRAPGLSASWPRFLAGAACGTGPDGPGLHEDQPADHRWQ
jgi:N-acetylglutamate synthase and related acetyltransferases